MQQIASLGMCTIHQLLHLLGEMFIGNQNEIENQSILTMNWLQANKETSSIKLMHLSDHGSRPSVRGSFE
jgi:hypothetical protein